MEEPFIYKYQPKTLDKLELKTLLEVHIEKTNSEKAIKIIEKYY